MTDHEPPIRNPFAEMIQASIETFNPPKMQIVNLRWLAAKPYIAAALLSFVGALVANYIGGAGNWLAVAFVILALVSIALIIGPQSNQPPTIKKEGNK